MKIMEHDHEKQNKIWKWITEPHEDRGVPVVIAEGSPSALVMRRHRPSAWFIIPLPSWKYVWTLRIQTSTVSAYMDSHKMFCINAKHVFSEF